MEEDSRSSWSSATNWVVVHGSLKNSITFVSPISLTDEDDVQDTEDSNSPYDQMVLMRSPSLDSGPCEIKISLDRRHEIRQVYVRSTARIYEIYYATEPQSINEYLCTVRCGVGANEDVTLDESDTEEAVCAHMEESGEPTRHLEVKIKNDNTNGTDEDGWVEVKAPDSPLLDIRTSSRAKKIDRNTKSRIQDFYEATAEITDASPCISLTLRLLSLQSKGCVHLGEIYIYAEPAESFDSDHQVGPMENSAGSSLMAMLVPTLMQLSKARTSRIQDKHVADIREGLKHQDGDSKEAESLSPNIGTTMQQEAQSSMPDRKETKTDKVNGVSSESTRLEHIPGTGQGPNFVAKEGESYSGMERTLDDLVCRVGRLEAFCLRFEENMLKPLSSIDTRLQQLEQQLELLNKRSQSSEFNPSTRITGPEFSCNESETNSDYNDESNDFHGGVLELASKDTPCTRASEFLQNVSESNSIFNDRNDDHCCSGLESSGRFTPLDKPFSPVDETSASVVAPQLFPHLIVTAPEFSNDDGVHAGYRNCNDSSESSNKVCNIEKPSSTIDDALASALAGFLSSTSVQPCKINQISIFKAPDFQNEDCVHNCGEKTTHSTRIPCERAADSSIYFVEDNGTDNVKDLDSTSCNSSQVNEEWNEDGNLDLLLTETDESGIGTVSRPFIDSRLFVEENYDHSSDAFSEGTVPCTNFTNTDTNYEGCNKNDLENVFEQNFNSIVDFNLSVLDVKFVPKESLKARLPLEALLGDMPNTKVEDSCSMDSIDHAAIGEQSRLFSEDELITSTLDDQLLVDVDD